MRRIATVVFLSLCAILTLPAETAPVTCVFDHTPLPETLATLQRLSKARILFIHEDLASYHVSAHLSSVSIGDALREVTGGLPVSITETGTDSYLVQSTRTTPAATAKRRPVIFGHIYDAQSGESLIAANIYDPTLRVGTTTNEFGYYSLNLPQGRHSVRFSYTGYKPHDLDFHLNKDTLINIYLEPNEMLQEIIVEGDLPEVGVASTRMGASDIPLAQIKNTPAFLGEADVLKTIQGLPGVQHGLSGTSGLHVRGGDPDQNLFLLDGMPLYNVDHALGFFSVFQPEAIKKVNFYKGSFPARFGGRLSSIVDVRTNDGDMQRYHGSFSIGLLSSHIHFEGPIVKDRTSFIISARRSYLDLALKPFLDSGDEGGYTLYDINAKLNHRFNDRFRLYLSFYKGQDKVFYNGSSSYTSWYTVNGETKEVELGGSRDKLRQTWGNTLFTVRLNSVINSRLFNNTTIAYTGYHSNIDIKMSEWQYPNGDKSEKLDTHTDSRYRSNIEDFSVGTDFDLHFSPRHKAKFGGQFFLHRFRPDVQSVRFRDQDGATVSDSTTRIAPNSINAQELNLYVEDDFPITSSLQANAGIHASLFHVQGHSYWSAQPRISLNWRVADDWRIKSAFTMMQQHIHLLASSDLSLPTDLWVPVTKRVRPKRSEQYSVGGYFTGWDGWELSAETYYKHNRNLLDYIDGMSSIGSSLGWEDKVDMGRGKSYGLELMAQRTKGRLTGWANYTIARATRHYPSGSINQGRSFPYKYDRRHVANITTNYQLTPRIDLHAEWKYMSGARTTVPVGYMITIEPDNDFFSPYKSNAFDLKQKIRYESRNNYRVPASHQLNLGINFHRATKHGERIWNISVTNAYNHKNPDLVLVDDIDQPDGSTRVRIRQVTILPIIPSFSYTYKF